MPRPKLKSDDEVLEAASAVLKRCGPMSIEVVEVPLGVHAAERGHHLGPQQLAHRSDGEQVLATAWHPASVVESQASAGDDRVKVGMMPQLASPGVEHQGDAELGARSPRERRKPSA